MADNAHSSFAIEHGHTGCWCFNLHFSQPHVVQNLIRGRGVFCRSMMKSQLASPTFTPTYAALVAIINTKFPEIGELLLKRVISQVNMGCIVAVTRQQSIPCALLVCRCNMHYVCSRASDLVCLVFDKLNYMVGQ